MKTHRDLDVWKLAMEFAKEIYSLTEKLPHHELYGLTSQLRRAAVSIASNIAEGAARQTKKEFIQFLYCSLGSSAEVETQLILAQMLGYFTDEDLCLLFEMRERISKMVYGLIRSLKR
jgi:four helix bundle protein